MTLVKTDIKKIFRTVAEQEKWHLESESGTYDEIAVLWQQIDDAVTKVKLIEEELKLVGCTPEHLLERIKIYKRDAMQ